MKTLIAVPSMDHVPALFAQSLAMLQKVGECAVSFEIGSLVYMARDNLAKTALKLEADYVFWLDSDMLFNPDILAHMLRTAEENNLDILTGLYFRRSEPFTPVIFEKVETTETGCSVSEFAKIPDQLFEVAAAGFGCLLMKTEVLMDVAGRFGAMFEPMQQMGEDVSFCWRARQCGYKIFCDPSQPLGHVGTAIYTRLHYEALKQRGEDGNSISESKARPTYNDGAI